MVKMINIVVPEHVKAAMQAVEDKPKQLPTPTTFHLLCALPNIEKEYESGIIKADKTIHYEELLSPVLFVLKLGPDAYADKTRFPSGPSCKEGDFVLVRPNTGTRVKIHGQEFRIINDDSVEAVVQDPRGFSRI
jgi:co-chaperonin GroES (HSP10)